MVAFYMIHWRSRFSTLESLTIGISDNLRMSEGELLYIEILQFVFSRYPTGSPNSTIVAKVRLY